jgi:chaperonin GroES
MTMGAGSGDRLARGAPSAQFSTPDISQERWDAIFPSVRKPNVISEEDRADFEQAEKKLLGIAEQEKALDALLTVDYDLQPVQDRIIVRRVEVEEKVGRFYVPDETKEKPYEGDVVAVGPGKYIGTEFVRPTIQVGDRVVFGKFSGAEVKVGIETLLVLREEDIFYRKVKKEK